MKYSLVFRASVVRKTQDGTGRTINQVAGEAYVFALGLAAHIERDMISDLTKSALQARKAKLRLLIWS